MSIALPGVVPRHPKDAKYVDSLLKLATLISSRPFNMDIAGDALRRWVQGTEAREEPFRLQHMRIAGAMRPQVSVLAPPLPALASGMPGALGLEPEPSVVRVVCGRATHHDAEASLQAVFVYGLADDLVRDHGHTWLATSAGSASSMHGCVTLCSKPSQLQRRRTPTVSKKLWCRWQESRMCLCACRSETLASTLQQLRHILLAPWSSRWPASGVRHTCTK